MKKNLFKVLGVAILGVVMLVGLGSCGKKEEKLPTPEEAKNLTVADVFQKVEYTTDVNIGEPQSKLKATTYNTISTSSINDNHNTIYFKLTASYDFEITKISAKHQNTGSKFNTTEIYSINLGYNTVQAKLKRFEPYYIQTKKSDGSTDWNAVHTLEFIFDSKELIIHKGDYITIQLYDTATKEHSTIFSDLIIVGSIVVS